MKNKYPKLFANIIISLAVGLLLGCVVSLIAENLKYAYFYCFLFGFAFSLFIFALRHSWVRSNTSTSIVSLGISFIMSHITTMIIFFGHGYMLVLVLILGLVTGIVVQCIYNFIAEYLYKYEESTFERNKYWDKFDWEQNNHR